MGQIEDDEEILERLLEETKSSFWLNKLKSDLITILFNLKIIEQNEEENTFDQAKEEKFKELSSKKIGRNEPCPCNSGKKI